jgi:hypothetical protein
MFSSAASYIFANIYKILFFLMFGVDFAPEKKDWWW